jgi:hypothetical protein
MAYSPPGASVRSIGRHHVVVARFADLAAPPLELATVVRVDLKLTATAQARAGQPISVEIAHVNRSPEEIRVPVCGEDRLLVDDHEVPLPRLPDEPCASAPRMITPRGAFVTRGRLSLDTGRHLVRARWHDVQSDDVIVEVLP